MKTQKGFTLVEILIVVVILGILAAIVLPQIFNVDLEQARYSAVIEYLRSNYWGKIECSQHSGEIRLVSGPNWRILELSYESFLVLKKELEKGEESIGTWTFTSEEKVRLSDARKYLVWTGVREPEKELNEKEN